MTRVSEQLWVCRWPADVNDLDWALYAFAPDLTPKQFDALRRMLLALDRSDEPPRRRRATRTPTPTETNDEQ